MNPRSSDPYSQNVRSLPSSNAERSSITRARGARVAVHEFREEVFLPHQLETEETLQGDAMSYPYYGQGPHETTEARHSDTPERYQLSGRESLHTSMPQYATPQGMQRYFQSHTDELDALSGSAIIPHYVRQELRVSNRICDPEVTYSQIDTHSYSDITDSSFLVPTVYRESDHSQAVSGQAVLSEQEDLNETAFLLDQGRQEYEIQLRSTFEAIIAGRVIEAKNMIMNMTRWLLSSVEVRGLHHDNEERYEDRLAMWRDFNHCWEALGLKQKDITETALRTRQTPEDSLTTQDIIDMVNELVAQCDQLEQYGLVDYEMGVWEEQIVAIFVICLNLLNSTARTATDIDPDPGASTDPDPDAIQL